MSKVNLQSSSCEDYIKQLQLSFSRILAGNREKAGRLRTLGTLGEDTLTCTMMGAREVLRSCAGWLMVSASSTTSCSERASSKIRSISLCTSADGRRHKISIELGQRKKKKVKCHQCCVCQDGKIPRLERVLDRSMMALLLGLLRTDLLASDMSAVTRVIDILWHFTHKSVPLSSPVKKFKSFKVWTHDKLSFRNGIMYESEYYNIKQ